MKKKQDKADELDRTAFELKEIQLKRQCMNADKAMVEAKTWKGLEDGAQREIKDRQNEKLMDQEKIERIKLSEHKIIVERSKSVVENKIEAMKEYDGIIEQAETENEVLYREERENIIKKHNKIKHYEKLHEENMKKKILINYSMAGYQNFQHGRKKKSTLSCLSSHIGNYEEVILSFEAIIESFEALYIFELLGISISNRSESTKELTNAKSKSKTTNDFGNGKRSAESLMNLPGSRYYDTNTIKEDIKGETME